MRSDRNLYSKNLIESQDEITEMKRKLKIMNHQIDQLKEEISAKESALVKEHLEHQRVEKEKDTLKAELQRMKQEAAESKAYIEQQESEERKLLKIISEADQERMRQKKELDQVLATCLCCKNQIWDGFSGGIGCGFVISIQCGTLPKISQS